jgi:hypothetical protein
MKTKASDERRRKKTEEERSDDEEGVGCRRSFIDVGSTCQTAGD